MGFLASSALILCGIISALVLYHLKRKRLYELASKFPGPPTVPLLGNALDFAGNTEEILKRMVANARSYASPYRVWLGPKLVIYVSKPEDVKKVLCSDKLLEKGYIYKFFRPWLGNGLLAAPVDIWRIHRKLIGPTFNLKILESFVEVFATQAEILVERLKSHVDGPEFEVADYMAMCTLDVICESAMGVSMEFQTKNNSTFVNAGRRAFATVYERMFKIWLHPDLIFYLTKTGKDQKASVKILHRYTNDVIRTKMEALENRDGQEKGDVENEDGTITSFFSALIIAFLMSDVRVIQESCGEPRSRRKAYLDLLMELSQNENKLSHSQLREEVDTMMVAGNDTTSIVIASTVLMLASFQNVQDEVYQELCVIYGSDVDDLDNRTVTHEDLPRMGYMERVIKETMRLFPVASVIARQVNEDFAIGEHTLPKGCMILVDVFALHRSETYWPNPLHFDPDRFLPEETAKRDPYSYLAFSAGPRNCIGSRFAMMEMKTIIATILRRYILKKDIVTPPGEIRLKTDTLMRPVEPIKLRIVQRRTSRVS